MNKILSQALKKAVSEYSPEVKELEKNNKPDLFSLNNETELFQNDKGIIIKIDRSKDAKLTDFGKATLKDRYLGLNESYQDLFARVASTYADDNLHAQRIYNYISNLWFMPATPVLSNGGTKRGLPISCFLNEAVDSLEGILGSDESVQTLNSQFGLRSIQLAMNLTNLGFKGFGVPGTLGGALVMNAGAFGGEISNNLVNVDIMKMDGEIETLNHKNIQFLEKHVGYC